MASLPGYTGEKGSAGDIGYPGRCGLEGDAGPPGPFGVGHGAPGPRGGGNLGNEFMAIYFG
jgi:hypothetical protein